MRMLVIASTVLTAQTAPPIEYASLNCSRLTAGTVFPDGVVHAGRETMVSRGTETTLACLWPA